MTQPCQLMTQTCLKVHEVFISYLKLSWDSYVLKLYIHVCVWWYWWSRSYCLVILSCCFYNQRMPSNIIMCKTNSLHIRNHTYSEVLRKGSLIFYMAHYKPTLKLSSIKIVYARIHLYHNSISILFFWIWCHMV